MTKYFKTVIATALVASSVSPIPMNAMANKGEFPDVQAANPHYKAISNLTSRGVINGFPDGTYKPDNIVTRAQAAKILAGALQLDITNKKQIFDDVPETSIYAGAINALYKKGSLMVLEAESLCQMRR